MTGHWARALGEFTDLLLSIPADDGENSPDESNERAGGGEDGVLDAFTSHARAAARARAAALYLPGVGGTWVCESAAGDFSGVRNAEAMLGQVFAAPATALEVLQEGHVFSQVNPAGDEVQVFLPIGGGSELHGCLHLTGMDHWDESHADIAVAYAKQGAIALELLESQRGHDMALLMEERERISRDLHDLGIQHLFATGMMLEALKREVAGGASPRRTEQGLEAAMERLDDAVRQIRTIVYRLRDDDGAVCLIDAIEREASVARTHLGFAPTVTVSVDSKAVRPGSPQMRALRDEAAERIGPELTEDVVAVVRESLANVAKHAHAHSAQVRLNIFGSGPTGEVEVVVVDDGAGVDPSHARSSGLANLQRRAAARGGSFALSAGPRIRGTSLVWRAPLG